MKKIRTLSARTTERKCWIYFVLDFDERIQNHRATFVQVDIEFLKYTKVNWFATHEVRKLRQTELPY